MNLNKLASAISRGKWLLEPRTAMIERQRAQKFLDRDFAAAADFQEPELEKPFALKAGDYFDIDEAQDDIFISADQDSVAVIPICGTIMKYDYCGSAGTDTLSEWLKAAVASPQIKSVVLLINSGGGSVEGTGEFADLIKKLDEIKPIYALSDGMIASAAYWIACSCREVWVTHKTVEIGSIGVCFSIFDDSDALEKAGYKDIYINADSSPDKNMDYLKALQGDTSEIRSNMLNPTDDIFMSAVKSNREGKLKLSNVTIDDKTYQEPLTGKVYLAEPAIENGLVDQIGTLEELVDHALNSKTSNNHKKSEIMATKTADNKEEKKLSVLDRVMNAIMGIKAEEEGDDSAKKADDDEEMSSEVAEPAAESQAAAKSDDDDDTDPDSDDDDDKDADPDDKDDDSDEDEIDAKAAVAALTAEVETLKAELAKKDAVIAERDAQIAKKAEEVKAEIKSSFVPQSSKRSARIGAAENEADKIAADVIGPKAGSRAEQVLKVSLAKAKAAKKL